MILVVAAALGIACGDVRNSSDAGRMPEDAGFVVDADPMGPDAAPPPEPGPPRTELSSAAARVGGATYTMDVQLGHHFGQSPTTGSDHTVSSAAPVAP